MLLKHPGVRPLPQSIAFTPAVYCARNPTISISTCPLPAGLSVTPRPSAWGAKGERGGDTDQGCSGPEDGGTPRKLDSTGHRGSIVSTKTGGTNSCCLCCHSLPCSNRKGSCTGSPSQDSVPSRAGCCSKQLEQCVHHTETQEAWVWSHFYLSVIAFGAQARASSLWPPWLYL